MNNRFLLGMFLIWKSHTIGQCYCHWCILIDILGHFNKIVEKYNKSKAGLKNNL